MEEHVKILENREMGLDDGEVIFSVHAIEGNQGIKTIKIFGSHKDRELLMLTYSGSRNGFINVKDTNELNLPLVLMHSVVISVADCRKLKSTNI